MYLHTHSWRPDLCFSFAELVTELTISSGDHIICGPSWYVLTEFEKVPFLCSFGLLKGPKEKEKSRTANNCVFTHSHPVSSTLTLSTSLHSLIKGAGLLLRPEQVHQFGSQLAVRNSAEALNT